MEKGSMRHLMWILTWIAVGIGGALGAASVLMLTASRHPASVQSPDVIAGSGSGNDNVLVTKPRPGNSMGRSVIMGAANRHAEMD
jgi:hypothetical protein